MAAEISRDHIADGVESLYQPGRSGISQCRVLRPAGRAVLKDGSSLTVLPESSPSSPRVVEYNPNGFKKPQTVILGVNGYMMPQTAMMTTEVLGGHCRGVMRVNDVAYLGYAHAQRGKETVLEHNGDHTLSTILDQVSREVGEALSHYPDADLILDGHSQGGQIVAHILKDPERFGLTRDRIRGAILRHSIPIPDSTRTWLSPNTTPTAIRNIRKVVGAAITKKGFLCRGKEANRLFFDNQADLQDPRVQRLLEGTHPAEAAWFLQTLLHPKGTSPSFKKGELQGRNIVVIAGSQDHLFPERLQKGTARYLENIAGARVSYSSTHGGHFSSILGGSAANEANAVALSRFF